MQTVTVKHGQSLFDISLQELGAVIGVVLLAKVNNLSIVADLKTGQVLKIPDVVLDKNVVAYFDKNNIEPASGLNVPQVVQQQLFEAALFEAGLFD